MRKFKFLVSYNLNKRIRSKAFLISNIFILVMIVLLTNFPSIISAFTGDDVQSETKVAYIEQIGDDQGYQFEAQLNAYFTGLGVQSQFMISQGTSEDALVNAYHEGTYDVVMIIKGDDLNNIKVDYYGTSETSKLVLTNAFTQTLMTYQNVTFNGPEYIYVDEQQDDEKGYQTEIAMAVSMILLVPMFILIIMGTQFLGVDIVEEKSSKAIETIIASVPAKIHFTSKIASNFAFIFLQTIMMLVFGAIGLGLNKVFFATGSSSGASAIDFSQIFSAVTDVIPNIGIILVIGVLTLIVGSVLYLVVASLFASMATSQEDYQQFQGPLMLILVLGFYAVSFAPMFGDAAKGYVTVLAFIPVFTPIVLPFALISGYLSIGIGIVAFIILIAFIYIMIRITEPIYKVSILNYDQSKFFKRFTSNVKKAFYKNK